MVLPSLSSMLPRVLSLGTLSLKFKPTETIQLVYNTLVYSVYLALMAYALLMAHSDDIFGVKTYSFVCQIKYCTQLYVGSFLLIVFNYSEIRNKFTRSLCIRRLLKQIEELKEFGLLEPKGEYKHSLYHAIFISIATSAFLIYDIHQCPRQVSVKLWVCWYFPGLCTNLHLISIFIYLNKFQIIVESINTSLIECCYMDLSCIDLWNLRKKNLRPKGLLKKQPNSKLSLLDKLLMIHQEACDAIGEVNAIYGLFVFCFCIVTAISGLSSVYQLFFDVNALFTGGSIAETNTRSSDFWVVLNCISLYRLIYSSVKINKLDRKTLSLVHRLINIYPEIEEDGEMYCLQFENQDVHLTAGDFFSISAGMIYTLFSSGATYLIILFQFQDE